MPGQSSSAAEDGSKGSQPVGLDLVDRILGGLLETSDRVHGGWGARQKFAHPDALHLLLMRWSQTRDEATLETLLRTLRAMQAGAVHDRVEGGFYRFARAADWSHPSPEKPLLSNAKRLLVYVESYRALGHEDLRETAISIRDWILRTLLDPETGAFFAAQVADDEYINLGTLEARRRHGAAPLDRRITTDRCSGAIIALLRISSLLEDAGAREHALGALDFLLERLWDPEQGAAHFWDGAWNQPGFLRDQGALLRALVEAIQCTGFERYREAAQTLARTSINALGVPEESTDMAADQEAGRDGSFRESRHAAPRSPAAREARDLAENAVMAEALIMLGRLVDEPTFVRSGYGALAAFAPDHLRFGFAAAPYGRAILIAHEGAH